MYVVKHVQFPFKVLIQVFQDVRNLKFEFLNTVIRLYITFHAYNKCLVETNAL